MLGVSRFLLGFFFGIVQIATTPLLIALSPGEYETHIFSYSNVISMGSTAIGSVIGGFLPRVAAWIFPAQTNIADTLAEQSTFAYQVTLTVGGLIILVSMLPLLRIHHPDRPRKLGLRADLAEVPFLKLGLLSLPLLIFGFTGGLTFPFYNLFFRTGFDLPDQSVGAILSIGWLGMAIVPLANPWWERHFGRVWALGITMAIAAFGFGGLSLMANLTISIIFFAIAISFRNVMQPLFQPLIMDTLPPDEHNMASSVGLVLWNIGWFTSTALSGVWQATYGFDFIMRLVAIGVLLNGASIILIYRQRQRYIDNRNEIDAKTS
jgi:MFS family permease